MRASDSSRSPSPLAPVLAFAGLSSLAAGTTTLGIFFVTSRAFAFSAAENYALGLVFGATYAGGALFASAVRRGLARLGLSARALLGSLAGALACLLILPLVAHSRGAIFVVLGLYAPVTGVFWPLVESYVSGGRRGEELRSAIGRFNVVWSCALLPSFWGVSRLLERSASAVFLALALVHGASLLFLLLFREEPGEHEPEAEHEVPAVYRQLLRVHRVLHATGYLVMYALSPYLPILLSGLGLEPRAASVVAGTWLLARVLTFAVMERWHGWHGRWSVARGGTGLLLAGFGLTVLAPHLSLAALPLACLGLVAFGVGIAALYTAALYYAFEVGGGEGGSSHEALIGLGYTVGPLCGLLACVLARLGVVPGRGVEGVLLALVAALSLAAAAWAARHRRDRREPTGLSSGAAERGTPAGRR